MANDEVVDEESIEGLELESSDAETTENIEAKAEEQLNKSDDNEQEENSDNDDIEDNNSPIQKRFPKRKKIIIIAGAVTGLIVITTIILYFIGFFDSEPIKPVESEIEKSQMQQTVQKPKKKKYSFKIKDINKKRLNKKLSLLTKDEIIEEETNNNTQIVKPKIVKKAEIDEIKEIPIALNTNEDNNLDENFEVVKEKTIIIEEEISETSNVITESKKKPEKENIVNKTNSNEIKNKEVVSIIKNKIKNEIPSKKEKVEDKIESSIPKEMTEKLVEELDIQKDPIANITTTDSDTIKPSQEEPIVKEMIDSTTTNKLVDEESIVENEIVLEDEITTNQKNFLKFAQIATIKTKLYLSFLHKINKIDKRISVCRNQDNDIQIFVGPFKDEKDRDIVLDNIHINIVPDAFKIDFTQEEFDKRCNF